MNDLRSDNMNEENLFSGFSAATKQEWLEQVRKELKDTPFEKLIWKTLEGINVQPMYFREDMQSADFAHRYPGDAPYVRGTHAAGYRMRPNIISQEIPYSNSADVNAALKNAASHGQTGLELAPDSAGGGTCIIDAADFAELLDGIDLTAIELHIEAGMDAPAYLTLMLEKAAKRGMESATIRGSAAFNPMKQLMLEGALPLPNGALDAFMADVVKQGRDTLPNVQTIGVDASVIQNAGGNAVQEIACALAMAVEYADRLTRKGLTIDEIARSIRFTFAAGPVFFTEIAKYRAARMLWAKAVRAWKPEIADSMKMSLHARTSALYATKYDPWVNILRAAVESMAAMLGGADAITVAPFDAQLGLPDAFSLRIARNMQVVLQEEAHMAKLSDPAGGSFYIDTLTKQIAEAAWKLFQEIESAGGFVAAMKSGMTRERVAAVAAKRVADVSRRKQSILGTNVYPNLTEKRPVKNDMAPEALAAWKARRIASKQSARGDVAPLLQELAGAKNSKRYTAIAKVLKGGAFVSEITAALAPGAPETIAQPLNVFRLAEPFEALRDAVESVPEKPRAFLATYGPANWRRARATFASGFLGCTGMDIEDNIGFDSPEDIIASVKEYNPDIVVLCSDDESYPALMDAVAAPLKAWKPGVLVLIAGKPGENEANLRAAGVHGFIYTGADACVILKSLLNTLGIALEDGENTK